MDCDVKLRILTGKSVGPDLFLALPSCLSALYSVLDLKVAVGLME